MQLALEALQKDTNHSERAVAKFFGVPQSTLSTCQKGVCPRSKAHEHQQNLSQSQEQLLAEWACVRGHQGIPLTLSLLGSYASHMVGKEMGATWPRRFVERHPELKKKLTTSLEACRAKALNQATSDAYFDLLEEVVTVYNIWPGNIWNIDEKGIQLSVGKRVFALIDCDQKSVYSIESGNHDLVTIIEAVCADGRALHPSVIFQGVCRDLRWGEDNPSNASISLSPNGWTDQELGSMWLEKDFEPKTRPDLVLDAQVKWRLLILDGHNSHCTFWFCNFAEQHHIMIICLPPHTTHALQPCDVGVFSPLSTKWKSLVTSLGHRMIEVTKINLLHHYTIARSSALKPSTIKSAFRKTGIYPLN
ncbi:DDE-domain-containing protein, partial [Dendrothele bispora CBS 962.96]